MLERDELLRVLKRNLQAAPNRMVQQVNAHRRDISFSVGDLVLVCLEPYRQISLRQHRQHKLSKKFYGPFAILERIGSVAYRLQLPDDSRIHPVFHVSTLKPFKGTAIPPHHALPPGSLSNRPVETPLAIAATQTVLMHGVPTQQVLVQWSGCPPDEASWEDFSQFKAVFPSFHLEDKVVFEEGENDTSPTQRDIMNPTQEETSTTIPNEEIEELPLGFGKRKSKKPKWMDDFVSK